MRISRRAFILGALLVGMGAAPLGRRYLRTLEDRADSVVRALCDYFVPGHDGVPGAVALGIDRTLLDEHRETRRGHLALLLLAEGLDRRGVFAMAPDARATFLRSELALGAQPGARSEARTLHGIYHDCIYQYLTSPDAWAALQYRTPQPHGYPDYTQCVAG